ncbi:benzoate 4-monooxygenase cytochrome p450 [Moniliophthora roreri]|uniref:Benzoate 4-monooxygenase cytochrome p450 n=1 Tax=Moniliophthora roreri TaxID=221103 RepID=A0A0W0G313_MONRR|nr:benzoate 4-monooxygenase cytochrome p450 [Moniliophthora roreri]
MEYPTVLYILAVIAISLIWRNIFLASPLSHFPGPLLAKWTRFYRFYYDVVVGGGWLSQLEHLHEVYGPVVRVGPKELHFADPSAYADIYSSPAKLPKDLELYKVFRFGLPPNLFTEDDPKAHAVIKSRLVSFFSRQAILKLEHVIQEQIDRLISQLIKNHKNTPANMHSAFRSVTLDIITQYVFRTNPDTTTYPSFEHPALRDLDERISTKWIFKHFPILVQVTNGLPTWLASLVVPGSAPQLATLELVSKLVDDALEQTQAGGPAEYDSKDRNVFYTIIRNAREKDQLEHQVTREYLICEGLDFRIAGTETVSNACYVGARCLIRDDEVRGKLTAELDKAWPDRDALMPLERLEKLPYLTAVIKESLRLSHGAVTPMTRIVPDSGATIIGHSVPPGTVVSTGNTFVHLNADIFPEPNQFHPERWTEAKDHSLDKYLVTFGKGPRSCLAINLGWSELYLILGNVFRKLELKSVSDLGSGLRFREFFEAIWEGDPLSVTVTERQS